MAKYASEVIKQAKAWLGKKESDGTHKAIIDVYNSHKPLARNYKMKYTDSWCATFVSAVFIKLGYTDIVPIECGCEKMINLFKQRGAFVEDENCTPKTGWVIFYDWQDSGSGDNKGWSDHVGIVEKVDNGTITVIEGNYSNMVKRRTIKVNAKTIRGYGVPKYDAEKTTTTSTILKTDIEPARFKNDKLAGVYKVTASGLNARAGAGTDKKIVDVLKRGDRVRCYGYNTPYNGTAWLLVVLPDGGTAFVSSKHLEKC
jgi:hypothetical protein